MERKVLWRCAAHTKHGNAQSQVACTHGRSHDQSPRQVLGKENNGKVELVPLAIESWYSSPLYAPNPRIDPTLASAVPHRATDLFVASPYSSRYLPRALLPETFTTAVQGLKWPDNHRCS